MIITVQLLLSVLTLAFVMGTAFAIYYGEELPDKAAIVLGANIMSLPFFVVAVAVEAIWF